jgi:histidinol-phosphate aminotransferase
MASKTGWIPMENKKFEPLLDKQLYYPNLRDQGDKISLHLNENAYPPPAECMDLNSALSGLNFNMYERNGIVRLESRIAQLHGISNEQILIDNGSSEVLKSIFLAMTKKGDTVLFPVNGWAYNQKIAALRELTVRYYELNCDEANRAYHFNVPAMRQLILSTSPAAILIVSPNAFTGNLMTSAELCQILDVCRGKTIVIVDQAYTEFSYRDDIQMATIIKNYDNVIFSRTLSKFYALANLRIGYAVASERLIECVGHFSSVFGTSGVCQAIACTALEHQEHYSRTKLLNDSVKKRFISQVNTLQSFTAYHSESNFVLVRLHGIDPDAFLETVSNKGIVIGSGKNYGLPHHVRITIGDEACMERLYRVMVGIDRELN